MVGIRRAAALMPAALLLWVGSALAADVAVINQNPGAAVPSPAEIAAVRPYINPLPAPDASRIKADTRGATGLVAGAMPGKRVGRGGTAATTSGAATRAFGSFGVPFTEGPVIE